ncbi:MAG: hypothetical protein HRT35_29430 [Algicola sp.]|nr:hypothetical protein [Algicola sp.]
MKANKYPKLLLLLGLSLIFVVSCSGEQQTSEQDNAATELLRVSEAKMYGAWQSTDKSYGYEFHASPTKFGTALGITLLEVHYQPEGIIYENSKPAKYFIWSLLPNALLRLEVKVPSCQARPLTLCTTDSVQFIELQGSNEKSLAFKIGEDKDLDGKAENNFQWQLTKKDLPELNVGDKSYFIETKGRAQAQLSASDDNGELALYVPRGTGVIKLAETSQDQYAIQFSQAEVFQSTEEFYVYNHGYMDINILHRYENVYLYPTFGDSLIVSYKVSRELQPSGNIDVNDIDLDGYLLNLKSSRDFDVVNVVGFDPNIEFGRPYFSDFFETFELDGVDNGSANQLVFIDQNTAKLTHADVLTGEPFIEKTFDWRQGSHAGEFILENDEAILTLEFLYGEHQRYRVIVSTYRKADAEYFLRDNSAFFFSYTDNIDLPSLLPRVFEFIQIDGVTVTPVELLSDGVVELNLDGINGGRWFFKGNNELLRFECTTVAEVEITDYQECYDSFQYVATTETKTHYSHITSLKFINRIGNNYLVQYDAAFWGGRWGREEYIRRFSTYYQWMHLAN